MQDKEFLRRRRLPHWDMPEAAYFLTTCLDGSIPAQGLLDLDRYRQSLQCRPRPTNIEEREWQRILSKQLFVRLDWWLDEQSAVKHLADAVLASIVIDAFFHFAGQRYDLLAYVVMPSHIHWVFQPLASWVDSLKESDRTPRQQIQHSINRFTSFECNKVRRVTGEFWQHESYDHWVRDVDELERIILYVENNPVKARLVKDAADWPYSSAFERKRRGLEFGVVLNRV